MHPRKYLSAKGLLRISKSFFTNIKPPTLKAIKNPNPIKLADHLMSALALFGLKYSSLLKFNAESKKGGTLKRNLRTLYEVSRVPSDTYMRECLDEIEPAKIRPLFNKLFSQIQRGKVLESYAYLDGHYLMPLDGTGFFSSNTINCANCCEKNNNKCHLKITTSLPEKNKLKKNTYCLIKKDKLTNWELIFIDSEKNESQIETKTIPDLEIILTDKDKIKFSKADKGLLLNIFENEHLNKYGKSVTYYHNMFCGAIVHPDKKTVFPLAPEPILKSDGSTKNDCEQNAAKRFISDFRKEHPQLKVIAVQDSIASNYPNLSALKDANIKFITGVKPGDHKALFEWVNSSSYHEFEHSTDDSTNHKYRYLNNVPLNNTHHDFKVNFIEYWEKNKKGKMQHFCWVTDFEITDENCYDIMRGGRSNWKIENNTFNTLKNQGYHFKHNFGHGYKHLSTVFGMLMLLAFFIDQIQETTCNLWQKARATYPSRSSLFDKVKSIFMEYKVNSWDDIYNAIAYGYIERELVPNNTS